MHLQLMITTFAVVAIAAMAAAATGVGVDADEMFSLAKHSAAPSTFPSTGYLGRGYDVVKAYPGMTDWSTEDFGFRSPVFDVSKYDGHKTTGDRRHSLPDGVNGESFQACSTSFESKIIRSAEDLQNSLASSIKMSGSARVKFTKLRFTASGKFNLATKRMYSHKTTTVRSRATCASHNLRLDAPTGEGSALASHFVAAVRRLPDAFNKATAHKVHEFVRNFGTHVVVAATFGSMFEFVWTLTVEAMRKLIDSGADIATSASVSSFGLASGSSETKTQAAHKRVTEFDSSIATHQKFTTGSPMAETAEEWQKNTRSRPLPFFNELMSIVQIMRMHPELAAIPNIAAKTEAVRQALSHYCDSESNYGGETCHPPSDEEVTIATPKHCPKTVWPHEFQKREKQRTRLDYCDGPIAGIKFRHKRGHDRVHQEGTALTCLQGKSFTAEALPPKPPGDKTGEQYADFTCDESNSYATAFEWFHEEGKTRPYQEAFAIHCSKPREGITLKDCHHVERGDRHKVAPLWTEARCGRGEVVTGVSFKHKKGHDLTADEALRISCCKVEDSTSEIDCS